MYEELTWITVMYNDNKEMKIEQRKDSKNIPDS